MPWCRPRAATLDSSNNTSMNTQLNLALRYGASFSLVALIALCLVWELGVAPLKPGGSLLVLKVLPLLLPLRGVLKGSLYTLQWSSMLILLYFMEGVVRAYSDPAAASVAMAWLEIILSLTFYLCAVLYLYPAKKAAKARQQSLKELP
ncbi:Putative membrane protein OS=Eoetvoesiella caeni OX=645616 GN=DFR37_103137 PE=4 SV=1 [Eoetvoesiella caeni]